ncbi:unnamed protein product, partial [Meganyctiphanes norvegica]
CAMLLRRLRHDKRSLLGITGLLLFIKMFFTKQESIEVNGNNRKGDKQIGLEEYHLDYGHEDIDIEHLDPLIDSPDQIKPNKDKLEDLEDSIVVDSILDIGDGSIGDVNRINELENMEEENINMDNKDNVLENNKEIGNEISDHRVRSEKIEDIPKLPRKRWMKRRPRTELRHNGTFNLYEKLNGVPVTKVLLLTYQRAGSSYTGELLTSGGNAMYVFEPLFTWRKELGPDRDPAKGPIYAHALGDLLDCHPEVVRSWHHKPFTYFRAKPHGVEDFCKDAPLRLLKTIRARASFVAPWLHTRPDIKVIHLTRDPRGMYDSVIRGGRIWSDNNRNVSLQCHNLQQDTKLHNMGPERYLRLRYEDLVDRPLEETRKVFNFMGVEFNERAQLYLKNHTGINPVHAVGNHGYLNTYRDASFRHDKWKDHLGNRDLEYIQDICGAVMNELGYTPVPP